MVIKHNEISNKHTCGYAFTGSQEEFIDCGVISRYKDAINCKNSGSYVIRQALREILKCDGENLKICNLTEFKPQLEISRLPHNVRERVYNKKEISIEERTSNSKSNTGQYLVNSLIDFVCKNYRKFDNPIRTDLPPRSGTEHQDTNSNHKYDTESTSSYYLYTDASYHPERNSTGISYVIIGKNGGLYAYGKHVEPQTIVRAELLAFIAGIKTIKSKHKKCNIIANTDCKNVVRSVNDKLKIDSVLKKKKKEILDDNSTFNVNIRCINRDLNSFADSVAKVGRTNGEISIGKPL